MNNRMPAALLIAIAITAVAGCGTSNVPHLHRFAGHSSRYDVNRGNNNRGMRTAGPSGYLTFSTAPIARPSTSSAPACRTCRNASAAYHSGHTG